MLAEIQDVQLIDPQAAAALSKARRFTPDVVDREFQARSAHDVLFNLSTAYIDYRVSLAKIHQASLAKTSVYDQEFPLHSTHELNEMRIDLAKKTNGDLIQAIESQCPELQALKASDHRRFQTGGPEMLAEFRQSASNFFNHDPRLAALAQHIASDESSHQNAIELDPGRQGDAIGAWRAHGKVGTAIKAVELASAHTASLMGRWAKGDHEVSGYALPAAIGLAAAGPVGALAAVAALGAIHKITGTNTLGETLSRLTSGLAWAGAKSAEVAFAGLGLIGDKLRARRSANANSVEAPTIALPNPPHRP